MFKWFFVCFKIAFLMEEKEKDISEKKEKEGKKEEVANSVPTSVDEECSTPKYQKQQIKRDREPEAVQIVNLSLSPKKRKQAVGLNPYSRIFII